MIIKREWDSTAYDKLSDPQHGWGLKLLRKLQSLPLRGDEHILDAGCGTGRVTDDPPFLLDYWRLNMYGRKP